MVLYDDLFSSETDYICALHSIMKMGLFLQQ